MRDLEAPTRKLFIIARRCGRLANRLTLFANFIGFVEEHKHRLINFTFHSYADLFESTRRDIYCQYPIASRKSALDALPGLAGALRRTRILYRAVHAASRLNETFPLFGRATVTLRETAGQLTTLLAGPEVQQRIRHARTIFVDGWNFRAPDCVQRHADKIRAYFRPLASHESVSRNLVEPLRRGSGLVIGVHIRLGDYAAWRGGKYFFPVSRYAEWMRELAGQFRDRKVSFLVCSNEPRSESEFAGLSVGFGSGVPVEDMYGLAKCDYILGPVSTFSQWASFYGNRPLFHIRDKQQRLDLTEFSVSGLEQILV